MTDLEGMQRICFVGFERRLEHGGIAQPTVKFGQDKLGNRHLLRLRNGSVPGLSGRVARRVHVESVAQEVGVNREPDRHFLP